MYNIFDKKIYKKEEKERRLNLYVPRILKMNYRQGDETLVTCSFNLSMHIVEKWPNILHDGAKLQRRLYTPRRNVSSPFLLALSGLGIFKIQNSYSLKICFSNMKLGKTLTLIFYWN